MNFTIQTWNPIDLPARYKGGPLCTCTRAPLRQLHLKPCLGAPGQVTKMQPGLQFRIRDRLTRAERFPGLPLGVCSVIGGYPRRNKRCRKYRRCGDDHARFIPGSSQVAMPHVLRRLMMEMR